MMVQLPLFLQPNGHDSCGQQQDPAWLGRSIVLIDDLHLASLPG